MSKVKMIADNLPNIPWEDKPEGYHAPVWRHSQNPVIDRNPAKDISRIFNSAVIPYEGKFIGVFRAETTNGRSKKSELNLLMKLANHSSRITLMTLVC